MNHADRLSRLMAERQRPILITSLVNIRYLTGFTGTSAYLVVSPDRSVFVTDGRYVEVAEELIGDLPDTELRRHPGPVTETLAEILGGQEAVAVESEHLSWAFARRLDDALDAELEPSQGEVEAMRRHKDEDELAALRAAAAAGDRAYSILERLVAGASTEGELGRALIEAMEEAGGGAAGWPPIVAVGANAARPHHRSGDGKVDGTGLLLLDYGCVVAGYHSDMTRTVWMGRKPEPEMMQVHRAVLEANEAGIAAVSPGVSTHEVDEACRAVLRGYGYEDAFLHSTGHGVGLEIHEAPSVRKNGEEVLQVGDVITVEPGVYLPGRGGVRIEDMVAVTLDGCDVLTTSSKEMLLA